MSFCIVFSIFDFILEAVSFTFIFSKKENNKIIVNLEIANENKTIKSFLNQKEFEIENFHKELILEKLKLFNSFYILNLIK